MSRLRCEVVPSGARIVVLESESRREDRIGEVQPLIELLRGGKDNVVTLAHTVAGAVAARPDVIAILCSAEFAEHCTEDELESLRNHRCVALDRGAARLLGRLGLEINSSQCAQTRVPWLGFEMQDSELLPGMPAGVTVSAFALEPGEKGESFGLYIPKGSHLNLVVEIAARWYGSAAYAPIVRQGHHVLFGCDAPLGSWSNSMRRLLRLVVAGLAKRPVGRFERARWPLTQPGHQAFRLGKGSEASGESSRQSFFFRFAKPTVFRARLEHSGSNNVMLVFHGEPWVRSPHERLDARNGEPLELELQISAEDLSRLGAGHFELSVTNFDLDHRAECKLDIDHDG